MKYAFVFLLLAACGGGVSGAIDPPPDDPPPPPPPPVVVCGILPSQSNLGVCNDADEAIVSLDIYHQAWPTEHYDIAIPGNSFDEVMAVGLPGDILVTWEDGWIAWHYGVPIGNADLSAPVSFAAVR